VFEREKEVRQRGKRKKKKKGQKNSFSYLAAPPLLAPDLALGHRACHGDRRHGEP
jgi:hypothetical protein